MKKIKELIFFTSIFSLGFLDLKAQVKFNSGDCNEFEFYHLSDSGDNEYTLFTGNSPDNIIGFNFIRNNVNSMHCHTTLGALVTELMRLTKEIDSLKNIINHVGLISLQFDSVSYPEIYKSLIVSIDNCLLYENRKIKSKPVDYPHNTIYNEHLTRFFEKSNFFDSLRLLFRQNMKQDVRFKYCVLDDTSFVEKENIVGLNRKLGLRKRMYPKSISLNIIVL